MIELALIPARGGSKGLPGKNIIELAGKPLIVHSIEATQQSGMFERIVVSTDDSAIAKISVAAGAEVLMRPVELAQDHSSSLDVIEHALAVFGLNSGNFCLLQPTSPLRNSDHIREAAALFIDSGATSVISANKPEHHPLKSLIRQADGHYVPVRLMGDLVSPREELPTAIVPNGAIYFVKTTRFLEFKDIFYQDTQFYLMDRYSSVDIDEYDDLKLVRYYMDFS